MMKPTKKVPKYQILNSKKFQNFTSIKILSVVYRSQALGILGGRLTDNCHKLRKGTITSDALHQAVDLLSWRKASDFYPKISVDLRALRHQARTDANLFKNIFYFSISRVVTHMAISIPKSSSKRLSLIS